jgi:serine/threonine-protein kinase
VPRYNDGVLVCPQCGKHWPDGYQVCPDDGLRLSLLGSSQTVGASTGALALASSLASEDELPAGTQAGEYVIEKKLGQGGMGAVYGARHPLIGKRAAVKVISRELSASQEGVDRFVREAQAVNQIGHPNIVDVFGFGRLPDGRSFFVMEWLVGETLRARMTRPLALPDALEILDQITTALEAAHEAGVLHRDLKPDNVFLVAQKHGPPKVKLLDFGLAKLQGSSDGRIDHTRTGVVMGTPLYLSPEQAKGVKVEFPSDIYSLGAIAYEMCAGQVPFIADSAVEIMAKHISERVVPLYQIAPELPPALDHLVLSMLEKDPKQRPQIAHVRAGFSAIRAQPMHGMTAKALLAQVPVHTPPPSLAPRTSGVVSTGVASQPSIAPVEPSRRRKKGLFIALAALFVVGVGGGMLAFVASQDGGAKKERVKLPRADENDSSKVATAHDDEQKTQPVATPPAPTPVPAPNPEPPKPAQPKPVPVPVKVATPEKTTGTLVVRFTGAPQVHIWVDGSLAAREVKGEWTTELAPGQHKVRAAGPRGRPGAWQMVTIAKGKTSSITLEARPKPAVIDKWDDE